MRKIILLLIPALMLLGGCKKEVIPVPPEDIILSKVQGEWKLTQKNLKYMNEQGEIIHTELYNWNGIYHFFSDGTLIFNDVNEVSKTTSYKIHISDGDNFMTTSIDLDQGEINDIQIVSIVNNIMTWKYETTTEVYYYIEGEGKPRTAAKALFYFTLKR